MATVQEITTQAAFDEHTNSLSPSTLLILSFHTPWAAPCAQMSTVLRTLAASYSPATTSWISINAETLPDISEAYDVVAVPYLVLSRGGKVVETVSGSDAQKVREAIERHAKATSNVSSSALNGSAAPQKEVIQTPTANGSATSAAPEPVRDLSNYAPTASDPATAPDYSAEELAQQKEDLNKRLAELVKAAPVMLFMKGTPSAPQCGFSRTLVGILRENGVKYGFFNILADDEVRQGLKEFADWPTFPQLWVGGELVGGLDIVKEELANDPDFLKEYTVKAAS